ncbi:hydrophobin [Macrolepiota fuliginosa MF-IS2]|uniref:Hydrophobin n=1 Tax=Macrolepiota fuliginosa MF-IS2 TaxID=1400762 RepID=A0A9P5X562_9AGAR|nr:hydrophobin [Macrolepiota fuliginosa MF-IS2]
MLTKFFIICTAAATIVSAQGTVGSSTVNKTTGECNVGSLQCCKQVQKPADKSVQNQLDLAGLAAGTLNGLVGVQCSPITGLGIGAGSNCNADPVCCTGNSFNGVIAIGCTPININL